MCPQQRGRRACGLVLGKRGRKGTGPNDIAMGVCIAEHGRMAAERAGIAQVCELEFERGRECKMIGSVEVCHRDPVVQ